MKQDRKKKEFEEYQTQWAYALPIARLLPREQRTRVPGTVHNPHHKLIHCYLCLTDILESDLVSHDEHNYLEHCAEVCEARQDVCDRVRTGRQEKGGRTGRGHNSNVWDV